VLFVGSFEGKARTECNCSSTFKINGLEQPLTPGSEMDLPEGVYPAEFKSNGTEPQKFLVTSSKAHTATLAVYWGLPKVPSKTAEQLLKEASDEVNNQRCDDALAKVHQALSLNPKPDTRANLELLQARIGRLKNVGCS